MNSPHFDISCVILCGGKSSRMGEDKSLLPFLNSNTLTQYQFNRLKPYFKKIYISSKIDKFDFLEDKNILILDNNELYSPIIALYSILKQLKEEKVFIITVDNPLVSINTISKIIESSKNYEITVPKTEKTHNLCGIFNLNLLSTIEKMLVKDIHKVGYLLNNSNTSILEFANDEEFINLNFKEDYQKALSVISKTNN